MAFLLVIIFLDKKIVDNRKMITQQEILSRLFREGLSFPPLNLQFLPWDQDMPEGRPDGLLKATWREETFEFLFEVRNLATPRAMQITIDQARRVASGCGKAPMVILPYLSPENLKLLEDENLSGLDLNGNGVICIPRNLLVVRSGNPNLFLQSDPIKNVYAGDTSIVARALILRPTFAAVKELVEFIQGRQGRITFPTVSKALKKLEEDLVVSRQQGGVALIQRDRLLGRLLKAYKPPRVSERFQGRCGAALATVMQGLVRQAKQSGAPIALTGGGSADRYVVMAREPIAQVYVSQPPSLLLKQAGLPVEATPRFPDLELIETTDKRVFFDVREKDGIPYSSPVQAWLELASGDKRQQEVAVQLRDILMRGTEPGV